VAVGWRLVFAGAGVADSELGWEGVALAGWVEVAGEGEGRGEPSLSPRCTTIGILGLWFCYFSFGNYKVIPDQITHLFLQGHTCQ
jgi:hypothetical protein